MSRTEYYSLVAGLREYALDADTKGFDARAIIAEILENVSRADARQVRLLYGYYDCENLISLRNGRTPTIRWATSRAKSSNSNFATRAGCPRWWPA